MQRLAYSRDTSWQCPGCGTSSYRRAMTVPRLWCIHNTLEHILATNEQQHENLPTSKAVPTDQVLSVLRSPYCGVG